MKALIVKNPFSDYQRGAQITDPHRIEEILAGEHAQNVTPTELDEPAAAAMAAPAEPAKKKSK